MIHREIVTSIGLNGKDSACVTECSSFSLPRPPASSEFAFAFFSRRGAGLAEICPEQNTDKSYDADCYGFYDPPFSASNFPVDPVNPVESCFFDWINMICRIGLLRQGGISGKGENLAEIQRAQRDFVDA